MEQQLQNVNLLPVLTWNWLGVNRSAFLAQRPEQTSLLPQVPPAFAAVETGMGKEAADFAVQNCTVFQKIEAEQQQAEQNPKIFSYTLKKETPLVDVTLIHARENSRITVLQAYTAGDDTACFHGGLTKIIAEAGAQVRLVQVQLLNGSSRHFSDIGVLLKEGAQVEVVQAELGASHAFTGSLALLEGYQSHFGADTIYFGDKDRKLDFNYIARHTGQKTTSDMHAAGALFDQSDKIYRGTIDFIRGASRSVGQEGEETLLFSPQVRNRTIPLILCGEENVNGQHAATIGKINAQRLFYMQSRGLSEAQAKQLLITAQFAPAIAKVPDANLRDAIQEYLERRLQNDGQ